MSMGRVVLISALVALLLTGLACEPRARATSNSTGPTTEVTASSPLGKAAISMDTAIGSGKRQGKPLTGKLQGKSLTGKRQSISVTGIGRVITEPDLAVLTLGVKSMAETVQEALRQANVPLIAMLEVIQDHGITEKDTQTRFFNIQPRYTTRDREQRLIGFQVTNQLQVKVRDLDDIGPIIDKVVQAGGDLVRIQGIQFTMEDASTLKVQAREAALQDALAKAQQFASLTGVEVGRLIHIAGGEDFSPVASQRFEVAAVPETPTPIRPGELDVTASVRAIFSIK